MPTFDGDNLVITLDPVVAGVADVDVVDDIYEPWKDWMLASTSNRRYPQAFRSDGGNPLSAIINQGSYIFLNNTVGWRIKPYESDGTWYLTGNLAVEDTDLPAFIPTTGAYTAAILGLQPITQGVTASLTTNVNFATFNGGIYWDSANGKTSITDTGVDGNQEFPLKNLSDVLSQAVLKSFIKIYAIGDATIGATDNVDGYILIGEGPPLSEFNFLAGSSTIKTIVKECHILGEISGAADISGCHVEGLFGVGGTLIGTNLNRCILEADSGDAMKLSATSSEHIHMVGCSAGSKSNNPTSINCNGSPAFITNDYWGGKLILKNMTNAVQEITINSTGGEVTIDSTCTAGKIIMYGDIEWEDNSGGAVTIVDKTSATLTNAYLERAVWIDTEQVAAGDGSQKSPFNTLTAGVDFAESETIKTLNVYADIQLDRQVKNFKIDGVGQPTVDCNGKTLTKSEFWHCNMEGIALGNITIQQGVLLAGLEFNGFVEKCVLNGDITINGPTHIIYSHSNAPGTGYNSVTTGSNVLQVSDWHRSLGIKGMTGGIHTIEMYGGQLHLDNTCTGGTVYVRGNYSLPPDDQSAGTTVIDQTENSETWNHIIEAEGDITSQQALSIGLAALAGEVSISGNVITFKTPNGNVNRMVSTTDANGQRTGIVLTP